MRIQEEAVVLDLGSVRGRAAEVGVAGLAGVVVNLLIGEIEGFDGLHDVVGPAEIAHDSLLLGRVFGLLRDLAGVLALDLRELGDVAPVTLGLLVDVQHLGPVEQIAVVLVEDELAVLRDRRHEHHLRRAERHLVHVDHIGVEVLGDDSADRAIEVVRDRLGQENEEANAGLLGGVAARRVEKPFPFGRDFAVQQRAQIFGGRVVEIERHHVGRQAGAPVPSLALDLGAVEPASSRLQVGLVLVRELQEVLHPLVGHDRLAEHIAECFQGLGCVFGFAKATACPGGEANDEVFIFLGHARPVFRRESRVRPMKTQQRRPV